MMFVYALSEYVIILFAVPYFADTFTIFAHIFRMYVAALSACLPLKFPIYIHLFIQDVCYFSVFLLILT
jgi:hypothetical protein